MKNIPISVIFFTLLLYLAQAVSLEEMEYRMHPHRKFNPIQTKQAINEDTAFWRKSAQDTLTNKRTKLLTVEGQAKNAIMFLGDGMSAATVTAARILKGQKVDRLPNGGEEAELHMDSFPYLGMSKTYCTDAQVADSACSATAYLCGVKARTGTIGVSPNVARMDCEAQAKPENHVSSLLAWAQAEGKSTGIVTTTRVTHASPAGAYASIANRDWENDFEVENNSTNDATLCWDIAKQLIMKDPGMKFNVILGGGRRQFLPKTVQDPETLQPGYREDGLNLIEEWQKMKADTNSKYVTTKAELLAVDTANTQYLLGLFAASHVGYLDEQERDSDPSLEDMTATAIKILSNNPKGFVLFVEGGRIDHAHHDNMVQRALFETIEFDKAIKAGDDMTEDGDTLIVITSDHAHVMSIAGYPDRGNPLLEIAYIAEVDEYTGIGDNLPYGTLSYANGPGPKMYEGGVRRNITLDDFHNAIYQPPSPVPLYSETHGGDDVLIFAKGPYAHYLTGVQQQNYIPHVMAYALCIGDGDKHCNHLDQGNGNGAETLQSAGILLLAYLGVILFRA